MRRIAEAVQVHGKAGEPVAVEKGDKMGSHAGANDDVDGHPAMVGDGEVIVFDVADGFAVDATGSVMGHGETDLLDVARTVRLVPAPGDQSTWVTDLVAPVEKA